MNRTSITHKINNLDVPYHKSTQIWQFDNEGQVTSVIDESGNAISNVYYTENDGRKHKLKHTNDSGKYTNNLLKNTAVSDGTNYWTEDNWLAGNTSSTALFTVADEEKSLGENSFKVSRENNDSAWPIARQNVQIPQKPYSRKFTFSGDIKTAENFSGGDGASLHLAAFAPNGQQVSGDEYSEWLTSTNGEWQRESVTITVPAGACEIECAFGIKNSVGSAYFDCLQLEESDTANDYNIVENSSFDAGLDKWNPTLGIDDGAIDGRLKIVGDATSDKRVTQEIKIQKTNPCFAIRAIAQGVAVPIRDENPAKYGLEVKFNLKDKSAKTVEIPFNPSVSDLQGIYRSIGPETYGQDVIVESIQISLQFYQNCNTVYFDNIQVCIDDGGMTYERNNKGSIAKTTNNTWGTTTYCRDNNNEITQITDSRTNQSDYSYKNGKPHKLSEATVSTLGGKVKNVLNYDNYGNMKESNIASASEQSSKITTSTEYSSSGNYPQKVTDSRGKQTELTYDENNGNLTNIKDANQTQTNYTYDESGRILSEVCGGSVQNEYSYKNGVLDKITHKISDTVDIIYGFARDIFDNVTETKIGNRMLAKNTYDAGNGLLRQVKYGNEQTVNYDYDSFGRVTRKYFGFGKNSKHGEFKYLYDSKNRLVETYDSANDLTTKFSYDKYGRLTRSLCSDGNWSKLHYIPSSNLIDKISLKIFGVMQTIDNQFVEGHGNAIESSKIDTNNASINSKYNYDALGRLASTEVLNSNSTSGIKHEVSYLDYDSEGIRQTTKFISALEVKKKTAKGYESLGKKFNYTYDDLGNITDIKDVFSDLIVHYEYDEFGQLVRENNAQTNKTVIYEYNEGGNLTKKQIYAYTNGSLENSSAKDTIVYGYDDENWQDKLTSYGDQNIVYDAIGNPINYLNGWKFSWARGKKLDKMENSGYNVNVSCKYDENGVRTQKTVNDTTTDFVTSGITLLGQKTGENVLTWQIDGNDNTLGFNYNGTEYFYLKNTQGDIIGITDTSGNIIAEYVYDSWGKLISITDGDGNDRTLDAKFIGHINPLRYRGYYYDSETGLYYLNARYYDPEVGRFISADDTLEGGFNLFAYCYNNPVNLCDPNGFAPKGPGHAHSGFDTINEAAIDWAYFYHPQAMCTGLEYGSNFYMHNGKYYYEQAVIGDSASVYIPERADSIGYIHSHHNSDKLKANIFAVDGDVALSEMRRIVGYVVTPAGDIQRYTPLGNYGEDNGGTPDLGTLTWIYYSKKLRGSNGSKWFWRKNDLDRCLDVLRDSKGSITGHVEYYRIWGLAYE